MLTDAERLLRQDTATHKTRAWVFWGLCGLMTTAMVIAYPPGHVLGATAGWSIVGGLTALNFAYVVRLRLICGRQSDVESVVASMAAAVALGVVQWLCGGYHSLIGVLFTAHVFGAASVLRGRARALHLLLVLAAVLAPAVYDGANARQLTTAVVWVALLVIQAGFLYEYGARLRAHRLALFEAERQASAQAMTDTLTGLGNRRALEVALDAADERVGDGETITLVYVDLDGFKAYNDNFGHEAGDALLTRLGAALRAAVDGHGRAYRVGGDEFCVLLDGERTTGDPLAMAIVDAMSERGVGFAVAPSCGLVTAPTEAPDVRAALRLADARMYDAKRGVVGRAA